MSLSFMCVLAMHVDAPPIFMGASAPRGRLPQPPLDIADEADDFQAHPDDQLDEECRKSEHQCPPAQRKWMEELIRSFDISGKVVNQPTEICALLQQSNVDVSYIYRTTAILWDPPKTWKHLFLNTDFMPCPHCAWDGQIKRAGWHNHGPRRVYHTDRCWWLWGRTYLCRTCKGVGRPHYYKSYNPESMKHLKSHPSGADLSFVQRCFPVILTRKAAISNSPTGSLRALIDAAFHSRVGWHGLSRQLRELYTRRAVYIEEMYTFFVLGNVTGGWTTPNKHPMLADQQDPKEIFN